MWTLYFKRNAWSFRFPCLHSDQSSAIPLNFCASTRFEPRPPGWQNKSLATRPVCFRRLELQGPHVYVEVKLKPNNKECVKFSFPPACTQIDLPQCQCNVAEFSVNATFVGVISELPDIFMQNSTNCKRKAHKNIFFCQMMTSASGNSEVAFLFGVRRTMPMLQ